MKKVLLVLAFLAVAGVVSAQETYSIDLVAGNVASLDLGRTQHNAKVCARMGLPAGCTQSEACVAKGLSSGCTAAEAQTAEVRIYPDTLAGREGFIKTELIKKSIEEFVAEQKKKDQAVRVAWCVAANQTQRNALCTLIGLGAGCFACD
jgi:hypothetical protein